MLCHKCDRQFVKGDKYEESTTLVGYTSPEGHDHDDNCIIRTYTCPCGYHTQESVRRYCQICDWKGKDHCNVCGTIEKVDQWAIEPLYVGNEPEVTPQQVAGIGGCRRATEMIFDRSFFNSFQAEELTVREAEEERQLPPLELKTFISSKRGIAGSMVFEMFNSDALWKIMNTSDLEYDSGSLADYDDTVGFEDRRLRDDLAHGREE